MADRKNLMEDKIYIYMFLCKAPSLKLNRASDTEQRARTCHTRNNNPLNTKIHVQSS